jgi:hypothetical protein
VRPLRVFCRFAAGGADDADAEDAATDDDAGPPPDRPLVAAAAAAAAAGVGDAADEVSARLMPRFLLLLTRPLRVVVGSAATPSSLLSSPLISSSLCSAATLRRFVAAVGAQVPVMGGGRGFDRAAAAVSFLDVFAPALPCAPLSHFPFMQSLHLHADVQATPA